LFDYLLMASHQFYFF